MITYGIDAHLLLRKEATGVPRYARCLLEEMMKVKMLDVERVVLYGNGEKPEDLVLPERWTWKVLRWPLRRGWTHGRLSLEMMIDPPDVLFVPGHEVPLLVRRVTSVVTTVHDVAFATSPEVYDPVAVKRQHFGLQRALHSASMVLTPSEATKHDLESLYHVRQDRIVVTPLAPTLSVAKGDSISFMKKNRVDAGQYIFSMSRLEKKKNTVLLIRAFAILKRRLGMDHPLKLVLAGSLGYGGEEIHQVIQEEQIADSVHVLGYIDDEEASMLLKHAMCFAFPSIAEGFGIPVLEAMEHEVPVVASNISVMKEVCGDAAVLVSPNDSSAWSVAMEKMMKKDIRDEYIKKGIENVKRFSWEKTALLTWLALRKVILIR